MLYPIILEKSREESYEQIEWKILAQRFTDAARHRGLKRTLRRLAKIYPEINIENGFLDAGVELTPSQRGEIR